jgi:putative YhdH/YhfP family quinone oxidoreductase
LSQHYNAAKRVPQGVTIMTDSFACYLIEKAAAGAIQAQVAQVAADALPPGDVLIEVAWSSLNYKDALSAQGHPGVTRKFPHVPGIDLAGRVLESRSSAYRAGDEVLVTGYGLGMDHWGGFAARARVPADWVVPLPAGLSLRESMIYGTAGFTAALCLDALLAHGLAADRGEVVVTGASGGVGSVAVALLGHQGFRVAAVTGKPEASDLLMRLGAARVIPRTDVDDSSSKPLLAARWAGAIDTVGGNTLATLLRSTERGGCVAACGLVGGIDLKLTVYPFILRGVALEGIDSAECPRDKRLAIWQQLAGAWKPPVLQTLATEVTLDDLAGKIEDILAGRSTGRVLVQPVTKMANR